jgi:response regulator RpfG family c-di-GMP phosphodiesterase
VKPGLLLVDDEERILRSLRMMLGGEYRIRITTSGKEALEMLRAERFHVLVSDQRMPIMPGVELLRQAKEISPNTMRLLLTGYSDMEAIIGSINDGEIFRYINKPWDAQELRQTIRNAAEIALNLDKVIHLDARPRAAGDTILLLDDDPTAAEALREVVEELFPGQYRLELATTVEKALSLLAKGQVAVVVAEVRLGGEDVTHFLSNLKHHRPDVVTVVLTSFQDTGLLARLINQGQVHRFLLKPARKPLMKRAIQSASERHCELNSIPALARRHAVQLAPPRQESLVARRVSNFFRNFGV